MYKEFILSFLIFFSVNLVQAQEPQKSIEEFELQAKQGDAHSQYKFALKYQADLNNNEAFRLYNLAAEQGHPLAQEELSMMYLRGEGVQRSFENAEYWITKAHKKATTLQEVSARVNLAKKLFEGKEIDQNNELAVFWLIKAGIQESALARDLFFHNNDEDGEDAKSFIRAYAWLDQATVISPTIIEEVRDRLSQLMSSSEIAEARKLSKKLTSKQKRKYVSVRMSANTISCSIAFQIKPDIVH